MEPGNEGQTWLHFYQLFLEKAVIEVDAQHKEIDLQMVINLAKAEPEYARATVYSLWQEFKRLLTADDPRRHVLKLHCCVIAYALNDAFGKDDKDNAKTLDLCPGLSDELDDFASDQGLS